MLNLSLFIFYLALIGGISSELVSVFTISRHGARSPCQTFPSDPFKNLWNNGLCQLSDVGADQLENLGKEIRLRYKSFLPAEYNQHESYFRSTFTTRTLLSAQNFIKGLYGDSVRAPIYTIFRNADMLLKVSNHCPRYFKFLDEKLYSESYVDTIKSFSHLIQTFKNHTGVFDYKSEKSNIVEDFRKVAKMCDPIIIWYQMNLKSIPEWANAHIRDECERILNFKHSNFYSGSRIGLIRGGPLTSHIVKHFMWTSQVHQLPLSSVVPCPFDNELEWDKLPDPKSEPGIGESVKLLKLTSYFAHDSTLASLLNHWNVFNGKLAPLASTVVVELHKDDSRFHLKFYFRNETNVYIQLRPKFCDGNSELCEINRFWVNAQGSFDSQLDCSEVAETLPSYLKKIIPFFIIGITLYCARYLFRPFL